MAAENLLSRIRTKRATIGVIGLGYVGLPLAILFAKKGFTVTGFLRDKKKVSVLQSGDNYLSDLDIGNDLKKTLAKGSLRVITMDSRVAAKQDVLIVCVPTPITHQKKPDITAIRSVASFLRGVHLDGKLLVNESTVAPGMTRDVFGGLGGRYFLACSPERVDPGNKKRPVAAIPKIVGGVDTDSQQLAKSLYESVLEHPVVGVSSLEAAEMAKMLENTYRAVNIALVNEFAVLAETLSVDITEVIKAASTKWSFHPHFPGIGVGGHCIPVDPYYILELGRTHGVPLRVTERALATNEAMPAYVLQHVLQHYKRGMKVLVYGLTYKRDVADVRESPAVTFCELLQQKNIPFRVYDPMLTKTMITDHHFMPGEVAPVNMLVVATDHSALAIDAKKLIQNDTIVIDGRNFFDNKVGKAVYGVGRRFV